MTCEHCGKPIRRCEFRNGCDFKGWVHASHGQHCCGSLGGPFAEPAVTA